MREANGIQAETFLPPEELWSPKVIWLYEHRNHCPVCDHPIDHGMHGATFEEHLCLSCSIWMLQHFEVWDCEEEFERNAKYTGEVVVVGDEIDPSTTEMSVPSPPSNLLLEFMVYGMGGMKDASPGDPMFRV